MSSNPTGTTTFVRSPRRGAVAACSVALALAAAGCSSAAASRTAAAAKPTVRVGSTAMGPALENAAGFTLYAFSADRASAIVCQATCTSIWPPLVVPAGVKPVAGPGVTGTLATVTRPDGRRQVTYNGLLLYTYAGDRSPGQTSGQGIVERYGSVQGTWSVVTPTSTAPAPAASGQGPSSGSGSPPSGGAPSPTGATTPSTTGAPGGPAPRPTTTAPPAPTTTAPPAPTTTAPPTTTTTVPPTTTTTIGHPWG